MIIIQCKVDIPTIWKETVKWILSLLMNSHLSVDYNWPVKMTCYRTQILEFKGLVNKIKICLDNQRDKENQH